MIRYSEAVSIPGEGNPGRTFHLSLNGAEDFVQGGREVTVHKQAGVLSSWAPVALECSAPLPWWSTSSIHSDFWRENFYQQTTALWTDLCLNLEERKEVERAKARSQRETAQHISTLWRLQQLQGQKGDLLCGTVMILAMQVCKKQKASQFEVTAHLWITGKASHLVYVWLEASLCI